MVKFKQINGGQYIGASVLEVISCPDIELLGLNEKIAIENNSRSFLKILNEFSDLCKTEDIGIEILWVTERAKGQVYKSDVRIFLILRQKGSSCDKIRNSLMMIKQNIISTLRMLQYGIVDVDFDVDVKKVLLAIDDECLYKLEKRERITMVANQMPLFYCDVVAGDNHDNLESLAGLLSDLYDSAVSFQIYPETFSYEEQVVLSDLAKYYSSMINSDVSMQEPVNVINKYYRNAQEAMFYYNILVFGNKKNCDMLASRITSILQEGSHKITNTNFEIVDLSPLKMDLYQYFYVYPWNAKIFSYNQKFSHKFITNGQKVIKKMSLMMDCEEVISFFRLPIHNKNMIAIKSEYLTNATEQLDKSVVNSNNIQFGKLKTVSGEYLNIGCKELDFASHTLIVGTPGTGKTTFSLGLLLQFYQKGIPFLAIEPTKTEYRALIDKIPELQVFTPGNNEVSPFIINPFIPPKGVKIEQYIPALSTAFKAAFSMPEPLDVIFLSVIRRCYTKYGWKDYSKRDDIGVTEFGLYEFILVFKEHIKESKYDTKLKGNLESAGVFRLLNLIEQNGNIYDTVKTIPIEELLYKPTIVELNAISDSEQKALIMALLLTNICVYTKLIQKSEGNLKNIILVDEAHVLLGTSEVSTMNTGDSAQKQTIKSMQDMIAEIRALGTGIIIADQSPTKVSREVIANTDIKVSFRLVEQKEKTAISNSINMDERTYNQLSRLKKGEAFVFYSKLEEPLLVVTPDVRNLNDIRLSVDDSEIKERNVYWQEHKKDLRPFTECDFCFSCKMDCEYIIRSDADYWANKIFYENKQSITTRETFIEALLRIPRVIAALELSYSKEKIERFTNCCIIRFRRKVQLETSLQISNTELGRVLEKVKEQYMMQEGDKRNNG